MKRHLLFTLFLLVGLTAVAGTRPGFRTVDMLMYRCYEEKKWDSVILVGKQALHEDIDYYYLRVRIGIAYFEKQEFIPATIHLRKARQFNSGDPVVADYLYRAYIYTNHTEEADLLMASLPIGNTVAIDSTNNSLKSVHFESGITFSSDNSPENLSTLMGKDSIYGEQDLYGNSLYANFGANFKVSNRVNLSLSYNYLNFTRTKYFQYGAREEHLTSITDTSWGKIYHYEFPRIVHDTSFRYQVRQHELYLNASVTLPRRFKIIPSIHWINVSYPVINAINYKYTVRDTISYTSIDNVYHTVPFVRDAYSYSQKDTSFSNWVASIAITKDLGIFNIGLNGSWSDLNNQKQIQAGLILTYYPLGNLNFYGTTTVLGFFQGNKKRLLLSQSLGGKVTSWLWFEGDFYYGDYTNANIFNGAVVYNNTGLIDYYGSANLVFVINKHLNLSLIYQYFQKESSQSYYVKTRDPDTQQIIEKQKTQNNTYHTNTLIGGITWKL